MENIPKVDFIGIGDGKSASSWIFKCLKEHPQVCGSNPKETNFFSKKFELGFKWYERCYRECDENKVRGEFSTSYMRSDIACERIKKYYPNVKLLVCLRHPVDRMLSKYYFDISRGRHNRKIEDYFTDKEAIGHLKYYKYLLKYIETFEKDQILVLIYEDLKKDPKEFIRSIFSFLEVDDSFMPSIARKRVNKTASNKTRFKALNNIIFRARRGVKNSSSSKRIMKVVRTFKIDRLGRKIMLLNVRSEGLETTKKIPPPKELTDNILKLTKEDTIKLQDFIGKDLGEWLVYEK